MTFASDRSWNSIKNYVLFQIRCNCSYALLLLRLRHTASCVTLTSQTANRSVCFETNGRYFSNVTFCLRFFMNKYEFTVNKHGGHPRRPTQPLVHILVFIRPFSPCCQFWQFRFWGWNLITNFKQYSLMRFLNNALQLSNSRIRMELVPSWSCSKAVYKPIWHIPLLSVQWVPPDDGQRNCPKHVEFHLQNKFEKLVQLVGFTSIIRKICCILFCVCVTDTV
jgi:hypothetical protein